MRMDRGYSHHFLLHCLRRDNGGGGRPGSVPPVQVLCPPPLMPLLLLLLVLVLFPGGCKGPADKPLAAKNGQPLSVSSITQDYHAGQYAQAYDGAMRIRSHASGSTLDEIDYIAALSAYQMHRYTDAEHYLIPLIARTGDLQLYGNASASLGLVNYDQGHDELAIVHFKDAQRVLKGQQKAEAAYHCGLAYQRLHQWSQARVQFTIASGSSTDADFLAKVRQEMGTTGWTIQLGAFSTRTNADDMVAQLHTNSAVQALGRPRILSKEIDGHSTVFVVQVGVFVSYESAVRAKATIANLPAVILSLNQ